MRTRSKTHIRNARRLIASEDVEAAGPAVREAVSSLDRAVKKGVLHPNNAARRKSRIMRQLAAVSRSE